jgi:hypothetical protein
MILWNFYFILILTVSDHFKKVAENIPLGSKKVISLFKKQHFFAVQQ